MIEEALSESQCAIVGPYSRVAPALEAARTEQLDAAVLDVNLAGARVYPVAEILAGRGIPFLLLSGYGSEGAPSAHPEWTVCNKPFTPEELVSRLRQQIGQRAVN